MIKLVDTHCHLQFENYDDINEVVSRAVLAGVEQMICVGTTLEDSRQAVELAHRFHENVWAAVGIHPHESDKTIGNKHAVDQLRKLMNDSKTAAVGEIGLDLYKNYSDRDSQIQLLRQILDATADSGLPHIFHVRSAWDEFWEIFDDYPKLTGVVHSFSAGPKQLEQVLQSGLYVGLNGIMTFTKDYAQLEAAKATPKDRLVLETDAPFLTPEPERGQLCEPRHVLMTAEFLAELRNEPVEELATYTYSNAKRLFSLK